MERWKTGAGFTIFFLFFGTALLDAVMNFNFWRVVFWLFAGFFFLLMDNQKKVKKVKRSKLPGSR